MLYINLPISYFLGFTMLKKGFHQKMLYKSHLRMSSVSYQFNPLKVVKKQKIYILVPMLLSKSSLFIRWGKMSIKKTMALLLAICLIAPSVMADYWMDEWKKVDPILECVKYNSHGNYTAYFGYKNSYYEPLTIPLGFYNRFTQVPFDRGQNTIFQPGRGYKTFKVNFDGNPLVWMLSGRKVTATKDSKDCYFAGSDSSTSYSTGNHQDNEQTQDQHENEDDQDDDIYEIPKMIEEPEDNEQEPGHETEVPEFTTLGAALLLIGSGIYMNHLEKKKKNSKR